MGDKLPEATYQDVLDAPGHMIAELIDGELVLSPRPMPPHATTSGSSIPGNRSLDVMRLLQGKYSLVDVYSDSEKLRAEPFEQIELDLSNLWWGFPMRASEESASYGELEY